MLVCGYVIRGMLICDMWVCDMWYVDVGLVIGIENVDVFVNFLVKVINEQKNQQ
jgi:hypothetical protein